MALKCNRLPLGYKITKLVGLLASRLRYNNDHRYHEMIMLSSMMAIPRSQHMTQWLCLDLANSMPLWVLITIIIPSTVEKTRITLMIFWCRYTKNRPVHSKDNDVTSIQLWWNIDDSNANRIDHCCFHCVKRQKHRCFIDDSSRKLW